MNRELIELITNPYTGSIVLGISSYLNELYRIYKCSKRAIPPYLLPLSEISRGDIVAENIISESYEEAKNYIYEIIYFTGDSKDTYIPTPIVAIHKDSKVETMTLETLDKSGNIIHQEIEDYITISACDKFTLTPYRSLFEPYKIPTFNNCIEAIRKSSDYFSITSRTPDTNIDIGSSEICIMHNTIKIETPGIRKLSRTVPPIEITIEADSPPYISLLFSAWIYAETLLSIDISLFRGPECVLLDLNIDSKEIINQISAESYPHLFESLRRKVTSLRSLRDRHNLRGTPILDSIKFNAKRIIPKSNTLPIRRIFV